MTVARVSPWSAEPERPPPATTPVALGYRRGVLVPRVAQQVATAQVLRELAEQNSAKLLEIVDHPMGAPPGSGFASLLWLASLVPELTVIVTPTWRHLGDAVTAAADVAAWLTAHARVPVRWGVLAS